MIEDEPTVGDDPIDSEATDAAPEDVAGKDEAPEGANRESATRESATPGTDRDSGAEIPPATPEDVAEVGQEFLQGLLTAMGLEAEIATSIDEGTAFLDVTGEGLGGLIGRRGQTLDALQEVVRTAVQRRLRARIRLLVDVEGYRARRRTSLAEYAVEMATRAKERGTEIELEPMSAYERKIVHQAVSEIDGASSFSEGEEPARKVVIRGD